MNIIRMNINHKSRMVYGSILLVLLIILYYYYTRMHEGFKNKSKSSSNPPSSPPSKSNNTPMGKSIGKSNGKFSMKKGMSRSQTAADMQAEKTRKEEKAKQEMTRQIKDIKTTYSKFYELLSDQNKGEINKVYNHFIENVIKDDYPPFK